MGRSGPVFYLDGLYQMHDPLSDDLLALCEEAEISFERASALDLEASESCWDVAYGCSHALEFQPSETAVPAAANARPGGFYRTHPIVPAQNILVYEVVRTTAVLCDGGAEKVLLRRPLTSLALVGGQQSNPEVRGFDVDRFRDEDSSEWRLQALTAGTQLDILPATGEPGIWTVLTPRVPWYQGQTDAD